MALSDHAEQSILSMIFHGGTPSVDTAYVSLFVEDPTDAGSGSEVTIAVGAYSRITVEETGGSAPVWNDVASDGTLSVVDNSDAITWTQATAEWGTVTHFGIHDAATAGNLWYHGALDASKSVATNDTFQFAASTLTIQIA